jgi:protoheme ferro-lyase
VIEVPRIIWNIVLYLFILPFRPSAIAPQYKRIWTPEGSPLLVTASRQEVECFRFSHSRAFYSRLDFFFDSLL